MKRATWECKAVTDEQRIHSLEQQLAEAHKALTGRLWGVVNHFLNYHFENDLLFFFFDALVIISISFMLINFNYHFFSRVAHLYFQTCIN